MKEMDKDINVLIAEYEEAASGKADLVALTARHPEAAEELVEFAVFNRTLEEGYEFAPEELAGESRFLARAEAVRQRMMAQSGAPMASITAAAREAGLSLQQVAERLKLGLVLLTKLDRRLIDPASVPKLLCSRLAETLNRSADSVAQYLRLPPAVSAQASYKADQAPQAAQQDFLAALNSCPGMSEEDRAEWATAAETLGEG